MAFHLYRINELYTNATGTVQFIELVVGPFNGENFWQGQTMTVTSGSQVHTFTFPNNLPSAQTANTTVLIGTQSFAALGIVTPDFVVPDDFLFPGGGTVNFAGVDIVGYSALPTDGRSVDRSATPQVNSPRNFAGATGTIQSNVISGTPGADNLVGTSGDDVIQAGAGNDTLNGLAGNDSLDGGPGADTAVYAGPRGNYAITASATGFSVTGPEGSDTLSAIERFRFADKNLAFDLAPGHSAGNTVRIIGAAFDGPAVRQNPEYVSIGLQLFDGGRSLLEVCQLVVASPVFIAAAGSSGNVDFVNHVYRNVVGALPSTAERDFYVGVLQGNGGSFTQAELLAAAAAAAVNEANIDLAGLITTGVDFAG